MGVAQKKEFMLVFEKRQYTIDQKIKLLSELIDGPTNPVLADFTEMEKYTQLTDQVMLAIKWTFSTSLQSSIMQREITKIIYENAKSNNDLLIELLSCYNESNVKKLFKNFNQGFTIAMKHLN
ncbi:hypothetical protein I4U23_006475 [Adineta vaga]|nr:hypothetical protein I4U23_006475 [Adineta vaga]